MNGNHKLGQEVASLKIALSTLQIEQSRMILSGEGTTENYSIPIKYIIGIINEKQYEYKAYNLRVKEFNKY